MTSDQRNNLAGKTAVVTGASKGIGASIARRLAAAGASVAVNYASSKDGADKVVADITAAGGKAVAIQADVSNADDISRLFEEVSATYGEVDILVNNAGVFEYAPLEAITSEHFHRQFNINVLGLLLTTQEAVKFFPDTGGSIINIGSVVSSVTLPASAVYAGSKAAVDVITEVLSQELAPRKIRVNSINPGMVATEGSIALGIIGSDAEQEIISRTPLGRTGKPEDIASIAVFLASEDAGWLTGEIIRAGGGVR